MILCLTGATGYLAANFLNYSFPKLFDKYEKIYLLDRSLKLERLDMGLRNSNKVFSFTFDINSGTEALAEIFKDFEAESVDLLHFAYTGDLSKEQEFLIYMQSFAMNRSMKTSLYFISSAAVYGEQENIPIAEYAPLKPINEYGEFKKNLEEFIINNFESYFILRLANPYGKEFIQKGAYAHFLNSLKKQVEANKSQFEIVINADGPNQIIRDMVYVDDFSDAVLKLLILGKSSKEILNISCAKPIYLEDLALIAFSDLIEKNKYMNGSLSFRYNGFKAGDIKRSVLANDKLLGLSV